MMPFIWSTESSQIHKDIKQNVVARGSREGRMRSSGDGWWGQLPKGVNVLTATELLIKNGWNGKFNVVCILPQLKVMIKSYRS